MPLSDIELVALVKSGHTEAFGELVRNYQDRVFNTCWRICGHLEDARDVTQDAFLKALETISNFREESGFYTWLFRIAVNQALSHRRKAHKRRTVSFEETVPAGETQAGELARRLGHTPDDASHKASSAELQGQVTRALQALDDDFRAVVVLRDIEELDYQQIGLILQIPAGTVKSRLYRARIALRDALRLAKGRSDL